MDLTSIISIAGKPGLYKVVSKSRSNLIVESLEDGKRIPVQSTQRVSALSDISIYTLEEDMPLAEVLQAIFKYADGKEAVSHKSSEDELREYMDRAFPSYDEDRVYVSDLRKLFRWYNLLLQKGLIDLEKKEENAEGSNDVAAEDAPKEKETKKTSSKKDKEPKRASSKKEKEEKEKKTEKKSPAKSEAKKSSTGTKTKKGEK